MNAKRLNGVLALEQHWTSPLRDDFSIAPVLELLRAQENNPAPSLHRRFTTRAELGRLIDEWITRGRRFSVLYIAGHGEPGVICKGRGVKCDEHISLEWLTEYISGRANGRWIHIGSCETLSIDGRKLKPIANRSGALGISGYRKPIDFTTSSAWELLWLRRLAQAAADRRGSNAAAAWSAKAGRGVFSELAHRVMLNR